MKYKFYQLTVLMIGIVFSLSAVFVPTVEAANKWSFMNKIIKKDKPFISGIARNLHRGVKKLPDAGTLSRKLNISPRMLSSPAVRKMALAGEEIMSHGAFAEKMLNKSNMPELVIKQYSHYGKNHYLKVAESVGEIMTKSKLGIASSLSKIKGTYQGMNNVINKLRTGAYDGDVFVRTIRKTGKHGMKVLGWLANHPKLAAAGAATAWYMYDPEGFEGALTKSGQKIGAFVGETMMNVSAGVAEGASAGVARSLGLHSLSSVIMGGIAIGLALLLMLSKTFRRMLLFPLRLLGKKANDKMDDISTEHTSRPSHRSNQSQQNKLPGKRKPRNNL